MKKDVFPYLLFPHTIASGKQLLELSLLLPHLSILQAVRPLVLPEWAREAISALPAIEDGEEIDLVKLGLGAYREFGALHGENALMASVGQERIFEERLESRFGIEGQLRGSGGKGPEQRKRLVVEAAVFMELARELDENAIELESGLNEAENLEEEFRDILGITSGEDASEADDAAMSAPLKHEGSNLSYMLPRRISGWLRLFSNVAAEDHPVLVALAPEVAEEITEMLKSECEKHQKSFHSSRLLVGTFPSVDCPGDADFHSLFQSLRTSDSTASFHAALDAVVRSPDDAGLLESLQARANESANGIKAFCDSLGCPCQKKVELVLTSFRDLTLNDIWACVNKDTCSELGGSRAGFGSPVLLLQLN
jgi:hypothetical protein